MAVSCALKAPTKLQVNQIFEVHTWTVSTTHWIDLWTHVSTKTTYGLSWFVSTWYKLESLGRRTLNWGITSFRLALGKFLRPFSCWMINMGEPGPLWEVSPLRRWSWVCKKAEAIEEQAGKQLPPWFLPLLLLKFLDWLSLMVARDHNV